MPQPQREPLGGEPNTRSPRIGSQARDLLVLAACAVLGFVIGARFQVFEVFERWVEAHEAQEVDEIFAAALFLLPGFVVISFWRRRELRRDIAARLRAEERVREAQARYRTLVEQIPAIVYIDAPDENSTGYVSVYMSPQVKTILGYAPEEFISDPDLWERVLHPDDRARALATDERFYATGEMLGQEYRLIARDGRTVWVRDQAALLRDDLGGAVLAHGVLLDVTDQKEAEETLREAEQRYRSLVEQIPAITYLDVRDEDHPRGYRTIYVSPQVESLLGIKPEELTGEPHPWDRLVHPDDLGRVLAEDAAATAALMPWNAEYRMTARDGRIVWVRDHAVVLDDAEGRPVYWHGVIFDITERKQAEEELREAEGKFRTLVEQIPAATYVYSETETGSGRFTTTYRSPQLAAVLGLPPEHWSDEERWIETIHPQDRDRVLAEERRTDLTGDPYRMEYRAIAGDGRVLWLREEAVLIKNEPGRPREWLGVIFNITERKQAEEELRRYSDEVRRANEALADLERELVATLQELRRVEAERRRLLDGTVHAVEEERRRIAIELHDGPIQHLTALDYTLETVRRRQASGDGQLAGETLDRTQKRLRSDISELRRMMASLRPPVLDERGLEAALQDHVDAVGRESGVECRLEADLPKRLGSSLETVLYRVVQEALRNVIKHASAHRALVTLHEEGGCVVLEVRDDGVGLQPEAIIEASAKGRFGLIGMRERVEMIGGRWEVLPAPGGGTRVRAVVRLGGSEAGRNHDREEARSA